MASSAVLRTVLILGCCAVLSVALTCDSCGRECKPACGTRSFRTCCFNYLKKRNVDQPTSPEMRLELLMVVPELMQYYQPSVRHIALRGDYPSKNGLELLYQDFKSRQQTENYDKAVLKK